MFELSVRVASLLFFFASCLLISSVASNSDGSGWFAEDACDGYDLRFATEIGRRQMLRRIQVRDYWHGLLLLFHAILNDTNSVVVLLRFRTSITKDNWFDWRAELVDDFFEEGIVRARYPAAVKPA
jgi:hypothetical protein